MSRISSERSSTLIPSVRFEPASSLMIFSSAPIWLGEGSLSKMTTSALLLLATRAISFALPVPMYVPESGRWRRWMMRATSCAPAVFASDASSPSGSRGSAVDFGRITPTSTALSWRTVSSVRFSSDKVGPLLARVWRRNRMIGPS
jgi:hypothetical protein